MKKTLFKGLIACLFISLAVLSSNVQASPGANTAMASPQSLGGEVVETMSSGGYTYMKVDTGSEQTWVAIPQSNIKVGQKVNYQPGMVMNNFSSKTLNKTFDSILFSSGLVGAGGGAHGGMAMGMPPAGGDSFASAIQAESGADPTAAQASAAGSGGSLGAITPFAEVKIEKAPGDNGYTVDEIFAKSAALHGKTVRVHAKVVKFSSMIMGRNWIHLQDGTGDPMTNTHDLVATSSEQVNVGDIITIEGVLASNKDFGAGYKYSAIIEEAKVVK